MYTKRRRRHRTRRHRAEAMANGDSGIHDMGVDELQTSLTEYADSHLLCYQCLERYEEPKILPCLHTFCAGCLQRYVVNSELRCPACKKEVFLNHEGVEGLKDNFYTNINLDAASLAERKPKKRRLRCSLCDSHDTSKVVTFCEDCTDYLCSLHYEAHQKCKATKYHAILTIGDLRAMTAENLGNVPRRKPKTCNIHVGENLKIYCETCDRVICRDCALTRHHKHDYSYAGEVYSKHSEVISNALEENNQIEYTLKDVIRSVDFKLASLSKRTKAGKKSIDFEIDKLMNMLEDKRKSLKAELTNSTNTEALELQYLKRGSEFALTRLTTGLEFSKNALKYGTHVQVLDMKTLIMTRLEELQSDASLVTRGHNPHDTPIEYRVSVDESLPHIIDNISITTATAPSTPHHCSPEDAHNNFGIDEDDGLV